MRIWVVCAFLWFLPTMLCAQEPQLPPLYTNQQDLQQRLAIVEAKLKALEQNAPDVRKSTSLQDNQAPKQESDEKKKPTETKYPTFKVSGFFHLDSGYYYQDLNNRATLGDIQDGLGFRRARLAAQGKVTANTSYLLEFDFAQAQGRFVDVWMQFDKTPFGNIRIGRYRQPFGMTELTSIRGLPFLERPLLFAFSPFRQTGVMLSDSAYNERMTWAISGYRYISDNFGNVFSDSGGYGITTRLTALPVDFGNDCLLHVGVDYSYNDPGLNLVQFVNTNEFFVGQNPNLGLASFSVLPIIGVPPFVFTGQVPTTDLHLFNLEAATSFGSLVIQSEARLAVLNQPNGVQQTFPGAYIHVRYLLTGEVLPYNRQRGLYGRVKPHTPVNLWCGHWGAWEVAARISYIDLNGKGIPGPGRRLLNTSIGLNWYVNDYTRFQLNWIHSDLDDPMFGNSYASTIALRGQIDF